MFLHTAAFLLGLLALVMSFSSWVLASIKIRKYNNFTGYNRIDPALLVVGVLGMFFFLGCIAFGKRKFFSAKTVIAGTFAIACWQFALGVAYAVRAYDGIHNCPPDETLRRLSGCKGLEQSSIAFTFTAMGLCLLYIATIASLASKHAKLPWTSKGQSAFNTPIDHLCPADDRVVEKGKPAEHH